MTTPTSRQRGLKRVADATTWAGAAAVALTGVFAGLAAHAGSAKASTATSTAASATTSAASASTASPSSTSSASTSARTATTTSPTTNAPTTTQAPVAASGSSHARSGSS